ncbi:PEP-CTERM sorting domain-containing protein [Haloferula rosea]|uniref:PEP-CTERM sorting domain-containing protein n=1 Tax=Haloferula rosea TaxID=490093 RepID=A0A934VHH5_9BACT|nr:PEP-CTERM sorting domain-containing protein [Haloferula rosea]MBK1829066.1 PEP-CTERM sorting domain-containing protein [Haloferula rosea]
MASAERVGSDKLISVWKALAGHCESKTIIVKNRLTILVVTGALAASANAATISLENSSFELPVASGGLTSPGGFSGATPAGWIRTGSGGRFNQSTTPGVDGDLTVFLQGGNAANLTGGTIAQRIDNLTVGTGSLLDGETFDFTLAARNANGSPTFNFDIRTAADPTTGFSLLNGFVTSSTFSGNPFQDIDVAGTVDLAQVSGLLVGGEYTGQVWLIANTNGPQVNFDNARLEYNAIPEPSSTALVGLAGLGLLLRRRK